MLRTTAQLTRRCWSLRQRHCQQAANAGLYSKLLRKKKLNYKLVIFDKDGTLVCFHSMWAPWARTLATKIVDASGMDIADKVYKTLGVCEKTQRANPGLLAEGTYAQIKAALVNMLVDEGVDRQKAVEIVDANFLGTFTSSEHVKELHDLSKLFGALRQHGVKVAVCTSDRRQGTLEALRRLDVAHLVDKVVCADDPTGLAKPNPHNALMICDALGVHPKQAVMVGDTRTDMEFAANAGLGLGVAVLTGVADKAELEASGASCVVRSVEDILPTFFPDQAITLSASAEQVASKRWKLVILDKDGSLADVHERWSRWATRVGARLTRRVGARIAGVFNDLIGYDAATEKIMGGPLAESSQADLREILRSLLIVENFSGKEANEIVDSVWDDGSGDMQATSLAAEGVRSTLKQLRSRGCKIAVVTSDSRASLDHFLREFQLDSLIDSSLCADEFEIWGRKTGALPVLHICRSLQVSPEDAVVVGDTRADLLGGRSAGVGATIGVLNGMSQPEQLLHHADVLLPNVTFLTDIVNPDGAGDSPQASSGGDGGSQRRVKSGSRMFSTSAGGSRMFSTTGRRQYSTASSASTSDAAYDYVIVGAGSAGCVLARRLTEDADKRVLLIEAGPTDNNLFIQMPAALMYNLCHDKFNWYYHTVPQARMDNRVMYWPRGRVWGGSSSLNAMAYVRGHAFDYDRWEAQGAKGWSYADCLPYFRKAQTHDDLPADDYVGGDGPLHVSRGRTEHPLHKAWLLAGQQAGYPFTADMNGRQQEGVAWMDMTVHNGVRWSTANAYLRPVLHRRNLDTVTGKLVTRILFDGRRACGVELRDMREGGAGDASRVLANSEILLCGGSINSPQLLMLSGIGPADHLRQHGIDVLQDLPGVGSNLQDHLELYVQQKCTKPITLYSAQWKFPLNMLGIGLEWLWNRTGWAASSHLESGGFIRSEPGVSHPDIQFHFLPSTVNDHGRKAGPCHAFQVHVGPMRPLSRGTLRLASADPRQPPLLDPRYMSAERDMWEMRKSIRLAREIFAQPAFDEFRDVELNPGELSQSDAQLNAYIRAMADSAYHPSCTCAMGAESDESAVLDERLRVRGVESLRVVDASAMPSIVSGNLNAPTIMLAEKAADVIRGRRPLPRSTADVWMPDMPDRQRDGRPMRQVAGGN